MNRWVPLRIYQFSFRRLLVLTTAFAIVLTIAPLVDESPLVHAIVTVYLLFFVSWCTIVSYNVLMRMRAKRQELREKLHEEYRSLKQKHNSSIK